MFFDSVKKELTANYYDEGMQAYKAGKEMWECPHVYQTSLTLALTPWLAGWIAAKQMDVPNIEVKGLTEGQSQRPEGAT